MVPFEGCWNRIERAHAHRVTFAELWSRFIEEDPYAPGVYMYPDGTGSIRLSPTYPVLPAQFSLEIGEILYQLRAALDSSIYESAIRDTGKNPPPNEQQLEFPVCLSLQDFEGAARKIEPLSKERRNFIESIQPYHTPKLAPEQMVHNFNRSLGILHNWARIDRHRQLHVIGSWASGINPMLRLPFGTTLAWMDIFEGGLLEDDNEVAKFGLDGYIPGMEVQANPNLSIDVTVKELPEPCADNDTLGNRIVAMELTVRMIVKILENDFPGHASTVPAS